MDIALSGARRATDAGDETDLGHIDLFRELGDGPWLLEGDWGSAKVAQPRLSLKFD